jgi:hypothetical protein
MPVTMWQRNPFREEVDKPLFAGSGFAWSVSA